MNVEKNNWRMMSMVLPCLMTAVLFVGCDAHQGESELFEQIIAKVRALYIKEPPQAFSVRLRCTQEFLEVNRLASEIKVEQEWMIRDDGFVMTQSSLVSAMNSEVEYGKIVAKNGRMKIVEGRGQGQEVEYQSPLDGLVHLDFDTYLFANTGVLFVLDPEHLDFSAEEGQERTAKKEKDTYVLCLRQKNFNYRMVVSSVNYLVQEVEYGISVPSLMDKNLTMRHSYVYSYDYHDREK